MRALKLLPLLLFALPAIAIEKFTIPDSPIQISQPVRRGKYIECGGRRAVLMGREEGLFESWIYPLKIVRDLRLTFAVEGYSYPLSAADLAEWITVRPESTTITYAHPTFRIKAHVFTPLDSPGSMILLDVDSSRRLSITVSFLIDLAPMWPGGLGGQYSYWNEQEKGFVLSESTRRHAAIIGCPAATRYSAQPAHNLPDAPTQFHIDVDPSFARNNFVPIVIAGGIMPPAKALEAYKALLSDASSLYAAKVSHCDRLRTEYVSLHSPDSDLNLAVQWAKVALDTGFVCNPQLGCGQVAGLGLSGASARPGFGWYFGGDTFMNSFAVAGMGDFATLRQELAFLRSNQRQDGKMMHELSQAGAMIPWFTDYPYGYYHADTTPLYLIAVENYLCHSGDEAFVRESWASLKKAYEYCLSTDADGDGMMDNSKAGLAAVETGKLLNRVHTDIYLAGASSEMHRAMARMAEVTGETALAAQARSSFEKAVVSLNGKFWNPDQKLLSFALGEGGERNNEMTAWPAVAMMLGLVQPEYAGPVLDRFAGSDMSSDWGVRMLASSSALYDAVSYNNGSVWPFLNGFASWAEYRNRRPIAGFMHWAQSARLTFSHALGYLPELLSGDYNLALDTAVPHQLFSSSGVLTPLLKGMLGFYPSAREKVIELTPQLPARWKEVAVRNLRVGQGVFHFTARRESEEMAYRIDSSGLEGFVLKLTPGLEPGAAVQSVSVNGKPADPGALEASLTGKDDIRLSLIPGLRIVEPLDVTPVGERSRQVKIVRVGHDRESGEYVLEVEGRSGASVVLEFLGREKQRIDFPPSASEFSSVRLRVK